MKEKQCMTFKCHNFNYSSYMMPLLFSLLAAFLPLGSTIGVMFSWIIFPIISIVLTLSHSRRFYRKGFLFFILSTFLLLINYSIVIQYVQFSQRLEFNLFLALIGCLYMSISMFSIKFNFESLSKSIDIVLLLNIIFFTIQFLSYYGFGYRIDYSQLTGGIGTRNDYGSLFRASGIFNEPAEYSSAMTVLVSVRFLMNQRLTKLSALSILTVILSFSFVGIFQSISLLFIIFFKDIRRKPSYIFWGLAVIVLASISFYDMFFQRYAIFIDGTDGSNNTKIDTLNFFINNVNYLYGGAGLIGYDPDVMPLFMQGLYDLTFFGSCISIFGIYIGSAICILIMAFIIFNYKLSDILLIFICLLKINVMIYASYWFFIIAIIIIPIVKSKYRFKGLYENSSRYANDR